MRNFSIFLVVLFLWSAPALAAADPCGESKNPLPACSYTRTNKSCTVTIDRLNPVTPPTIYILPTCKIQVQTDTPNHLYQLEHLTLDWKSNTTVVPPDTFQNAFSSLSTNLGKITVIGFAPAAVAALCEDSAGGCTSAAEISRAQERVSSIDPFAGITSDIASIKMALQPPPGGTDNPGSPWTATAGWQTTTVSHLQAAAAGISLKKIQTEQSNLAADIAKLKNPASTQAEKDAVDQLTANQKVLDGQVSAISDTVDKINALATGIQALSLNETGIVGNQTIADTTPGDKNYQMQTWTLNYSNKLLPIAKRVAADKLKSANAAYFGSLADASDKQPIVTLTVQFQSPSHFEFSTGLVVPVTPYHSYAKGSDASGNPTVPETKTYAVVPIALVHYRLWEWSARQDRSAFFVTGGIGVNSATSQVEFGAGLTYSYRSLAINFLADIGRDTQLGGRLTPNGSLGLYAAPPMTSTWGAKFAPGISVRIPLGGGASTVGSSSTGH